MDPVSPDSFEQPREHRPSDGVEPEREREPPLSIPLDRLKNSEAQSDFARGFLTGCIATVILLPLTIFILFFIVCSRM
jgi:hypothetical protein